MLFIARAITDRPAISSYFISATPFVIRFGCAWVILPLDVRILLPPASRSNSGIRKLPLPQSACRPHRPLQIESSPETYRTPSLLGKTKLIPFAADFKTIQMPASNYMIATFRLCRSPSSLLIPRRNPASNLVGVPQALLRSSSSVCRSIVFGLADSSNSKCPFNSSTASMNFDTTNVLPEIFNCELFTLCNFDKFHACAFKQPRAAKLSCHHRQSRHRTKLNRQRSDCNS